MTYKRGNRFIPSASVTAFFHRTSPIRPFRNRICVNRPFIQECGNVKWEKIRIFDEKEETLLSLFHEIGVPRHIAALVIYLTSESDVSSKDIETATGLRQSEVSRAIRFLNQNQWLSFHTARYYATGRPRRLYSLTVPVEEIFDYFLIRKKAIYKNRYRSAEEIGRVLRRSFSEAALIRDPAAAAYSVSGNDDVAAVNGEAVSATDMPDDPSD